MTNLKFPWQKKIVIQQSLRILNSFHHWTGRCLLETKGSPLEIAQQMFEAPLVILSHGTEPDPIFNYGNRMALQMWELTWDELIQMPSRQSAEAMIQQERDRLLEETAAKGISNWRGIRISSTGKRFQVENGLIWNVIDENYQPCGQAAVYSDYQFIE